MGSSTNAEIKETRIYARKTLTALDCVGRLYINDHLESHVACRGNLSFRTTDEIHQAIAALRELLPLVDRLGSLVDPELPQTE